MNFFRNTCRFLQVIEGPASPKISKGPKYKELQWRSLSAECVSSLSLWEPTLTSCISNETSESPIGKPKPSPKLLEPLFACDLSSNVVTVPLRQLRIKPLIACSLSFGPTMTILYICSVAEFEMPSNKRLLRGSPDECGELLLIEVPAGVKTVEKACRGSIHATSNLIVLYLSSALIKYGCESYLLQMLSTFTARFFGFKSWGQV